MKFLNAKILVGTILIAIIPHAMRAGEVPVEVDAVRTFGKWENAAGDYGEYRVVISAQGWEDIRYKVCMERIIVRSDPRERKIADSTIITEGPNGFRLADYRLENQTLVLEYISTVGTGTMRIIATAGQDGRISTKTNTSSQTNSSQPANDKDSPSGKGESPNDSHSAPRQPPEGPPPAKPGSAPQ